MHILDSFTSSFAIYNLLNSFSLISASRTTNTMRNKSDESVHPCISPDLRYNAFSCWVSMDRGAWWVTVHRVAKSWTWLKRLSKKKRKKNYVSDGFVIYGPYYVEVCFFYAHFVACFYHWLMLNFVKSFYYVYWDNHVILSFTILSFTTKVVCHIDWFVNIKLFLHLWDKCHLINI